MMIRIVNRLPLASARRFFFTVEMRDCQEGVSFAKTLLTVLEFFSRSPLPSNVCKASAWGDAYNGLSGG